MFYSGEIGGFVGFPCWTVDIVIINACNQEGNHGRRNIVRRNFCNLKATTGFDHHMEYGRIVVGSSLYILFCDTVLAIYIENRSESNTEC